MKNGKHNRILEHAAPVVCGTSVRVPILNNSVALEPGDRLAVLPLAAVKQRNAVNALTRRTNAVWRNSLVATEFFATSVEFIGW